MKKKCLLVVFSIVMGGMLSGCMTVNYSMKGTGQYENVQKTRQVSAGTRTVYDVTIEPESLPEDSNVTIPLGDGFQTTVRGPGTVYTGMQGKQRANPNLKLPPQHYTYSDASTAQQAVNAIRAYGGIASVISRQDMATATERYTVKEEVMAPDYSRPPKATISILNTFLYAFYSAFAVYSFAGMPGVTNPETSKPISEDYNTCLLTGIVCSIPALLDIYRTITHKKGRTGSYGPIEYFVHNPLKEMQESKK